MVPETTTQTDAETTTITDDVIESFAQDPSFTRLNHRVDATVDGADVRAVFAHDGESTKVIITADAEVIEVEPHGDHCSHCDANEMYTPRRGTPNETRAKERHDAYCRHANVASNTKSLGDAHTNDDDNACPNCDHYAIAVKVTPITRRTPHGDRVHVGDVEERRCGHCAHHR